MGVVVSVSEMNGIELMALNWNGTTVSPTR